MADDDLDEDFDPDAIEEDIDEEVIDPDAIDPDAIDPDVIDPDVIDPDAIDDIVDDDLAPTDELDDPAVVDATVPVEEPAANRVKKRAEDDEDDDEEVDPDDVEADLDTILKDRIAAVDDDEDDEELDEQPRPTADAPDGVVPKRANEFMCTGCFLLVNRGQFGPESNLQCPVGESECPAIAELQRSGRPRPAKTGRKR
jgi:hypothetical protein